MPEQLNLTDPGVVLSFRANMMCRDLVGVLNDKLSGLRLSTADGADPQVLIALSNLNRAIVKLDQATTAHLERMDR